MQQKTHDFLVRMRVPMATFGGDLMGEAIDFAIQEMRNAIAFNDKDNFLRIHDLKTGAAPAHMEQLFIYDALFCMEYHVKPKDILIENRIYQNDDVLIETPTADIIDPIIEKIKEFDKIIADLR